MKIRMFELWFRVRNRLVGTQQSKMRDEKKSLWMSTADDKNILDYPLKQSCVLIIYLSTCNIRYIYVCVDYFSLFFSSIFCFLFFSWMTCVLQTDMIASFYHWILFYQYKNCFLPHIALWVWWHVRFCAQWFILERSVLSALYISYMYSVFSRNRTQLHGFVIDSSARYERIYAEQKNNLVSHS